MRSSNFCWEIHHLCNAFPWHCDWLKDNLHFNMTDYGIINVWLVGCCSLTSCLRRDLAIVIIRMNLICTRISWWGTYRVRRKKIVADQNADFTLVNHQSPLHQSWKSESMKKNRSIAHFISPRTFFFSVEFISLFIYLLEDVFSRSFLWHLCS